jgi:phage shock protein PspC (stress-responsive transcriptional regulator)
MKKTFTANISGMVFHIDEDAYEKLNLYLARIKEKLSLDHGRDEILNDIEARIAEMLQEKLTASKKVITLEDVRYVIEQLGEPEQFEEAAEETAAHETHSRKTYYREKSEKRFYRDPDDKYIGGVAGGLGAFFDIDPTWIRVAFVVFTFLYGFGPLVYIILWIVVPKARTTAEKLEMRGEKVTLSNIEKSIREELDDLKTNIKEFSEETKEHFKKKSKTVNDHNSRIASDLVKAFAKVAGVILILLSFSFIIAIISGIYMFPVWGNFPHFTGLDSVPEFLSAFLSSDAWISATTLALAGLIGIPVFWMLLVGIQLLFEIKTTSRYLGAFTFLLWLVAIGTIALAAVSSVRNFSGHNTSRDEIVLANSSWANMYVRLDDSRQFRTSKTSFKRGNKEWHQWHHYWMNSEGQAYGMPKLRIKPSDDDQTRLYIIKEARGMGDYQAGLNAENIRYSFSQKDSLLILDPVFIYNKSDGWRDQRITLELSIPEHKIAVMDKNVRQNISTWWNGSVNVIEK